MKSHFFKLPKEEQLAFIQETAERLDVSDAIVEKDLWVCWLLEKLFELPIQMTFKGGTSLAKVFNLIKRFSEDCDITIDNHLFKSDHELAVINRSHLKKITLQLKEQLKSIVLDTIAPYLQNQISKMFPAQNIEIHTREEGEQLHVYYPSITSTAREYVRDHVLIEFGIRNCTQPCERHSIETYLSQVVDQTIELPKPMINTLSPIRTFWEKATLMHVECHRDRFVETPERLSRHWYDLYMLNQSWVGAQALASQEILESVIHYKKAFFNASYTHYDHCLNGEIKLIPESKNQKSLERDFKRMVQAEMFYEQPPSFSVIVESLEKLEEDINKRVNIHKV